MSSQIQILWQSMMDQIQQFDLLLLIIIIIVLLLKLNLNQAKQCKCSNNSELWQHYTCDARIKPSILVFKCTCDFLCSLLFSVALYWSAAEGSPTTPPPFHGVLDEAFLAILNGTMVLEYRADSCFIEPVYNVCWMEHINRFMLSPLFPFSSPPQTEKKEKSKIEEKEWEREKKREKSLLSQFGTMTAFSTGVICQPLLALQLTKEAAVWNGVQERSRV